VSKGRPASLAIEINPVDKYGAITKKRGIVLRSGSELNERIIREIEQTEKEMRSKDLREESAEDRYFELGIK
jgi:hypothetical protein